VEGREKRKDAQLARQLRIALPIELTLAEQWALLIGYVTTHFLSGGMGADVSLLESADDPSGYCLLA
jgi:hypothetical protein